MPGQGQTVNIAGVKVGEIGEVELEDGRAVVEMKIKDEYKPIYRDATILLRPKTGLKDMYPPARPGHAAPASSRRAAACRCRNTLPDVNPDEVLAAARRRHARLPARPAERGRHGVRRRGDRRGRSYDQTAAQDLRETFKRFEPTARDGEQITRLLAQRRANIAPRDPQLPGALDRARPNATASSPRSSTPPTRTSRRSPPRRRRCARRCSCSRARSTRPSTTLDKTDDAGRASSGPTLERPAPVRARPGAGAAQDAAVPARDHADHPRPDPPVRARRPADGARPPQRDARTWRWSRRGSRAASRCSTSSSTRSPTTRPARPSRTCSGAPGRRTRARRSSTSRTRTGRCAAASCSFPARATRRSSRSWRATRSSARPRVSTLPARVRRLPAATRRTTGSP